MTRNDFYVYALLDPRKPGPFWYGHWKFEYEPFYIGKGTGNRAYGHDRIFSATNKHNSHKNNKIRKILRETGEPHYIVTKKSGLTERQALDLEILLITLIGRTQLNIGPLTNKSNGGDGGGTGAIRTRKHKRLLSKAARVLWLARTEAEKKKLFAKRAETNASKSYEEKASLAKHHSEALRTRSKAAQAKTNRRAKETRDKKTELQKECTRKKISQGIKDYVKNNPEQHAKNIHNRKQTQQSQAYRARQPQALKLANKQNPTLAIQNSRRQGGTKIKTYLGGKFVGFFNTQAEASRALGVHVGNMNKVLRGERQHTCGYSFKRAP